MDNKKMFGAMAAVMLLVLGYYLFLIKFVYPRHPDWDFSGQHNQPTATTSSSTPGLEATSAPSTSASSTPSMSASTAPSDIRLVGAEAPPADVTIGSLKEGDPLALGLKISPAGAGLDSVTINQAKAISDDPNKRSLYTFLQPYSQQPDLRPMATRSVTLNGRALDSLNLPWKIEAQTTTAATFGVDLVSPTGSALVHLTKMYQVEPAIAGKDRDNTPAGFEVNVVYHMQNLVNIPQTVRIAFEGPTMPPREIERSDDRQVIVGYDAGNNTVEVVRYALSDFKPGYEVKDVSASTKGNKFLWGGSSSVYFAAIVRPLKPPQIEKVVARALNPQADSESRLIAMDFETADIKLGANETADVPLKFFCGPKERSLLEGDYYSAFPRDYKELLAVSSFCGICTVGWLVDRLVDLLAFFHMILRDWGLAIILLVVIVRSLLHPITKHSQVSMLKMQKMGPELERLKKKYGDDKEGYAKAQMQLYKGMGFTPVLGCLPMFLQMPIWIALYSALQNEYRLRQEPFLWGWTWIHDLARPDRLISWDAHAFTIPLIGIKIVSLNVLPILMAAVFYLQQKYTPKPPAATPEQEQQQKMMQWMSLLFPVFLYPAPSGLNLYILTSTAIGVIESKRIRDHIKQQQEREKGDKVIIDAKPTRQGKVSKREEAAAKTAEKPGCLGGLWANMQQKVAEIQAEAERKKDK